MIEVTGNLWTYSPADFRVITTNGSVRRDGRAVMERGCAREAAQRFFTLPRLLGEHLHAHGNHVRFFSDFNLFSFPVKHRWMQPADLDLIRRSVEELRRQLLESCIYVMPRPGCGNGQRTWDEVRPIVGTLPDNILVITFDAIPC